MTAARGSGVSAWLTSTAQTLRAFYARPLAWGASLFVSATLAYAGGGIMFWLHAIYRGEQGPAIGHWQHWLLDSTLGFLALTPVVFVLLPLVWWVLGRRDGGRRAVPIGVYVAIVGTLFSLVTGPGPLMHNAIAGAGTPLADAATDVFGHNPDIAHHHADAPERSAFTEGVLQVAVGIPAYSTLTLVSIVAVRSATGRRRRTEGEGEPLVMSGAARR